VRALQQQGFSLREISRHLKISRQTVRRFVRAEAFPERSRPPKKASLLDPYKPYLLERGQAGCWNGSQLYSEVKARGYPGSVALFRLFISSVHKQHRAEEIEARSNCLLTGPKSMDPPILFPNPASNAACQERGPAFLYVSQAGKLDEKQREQIAQIRAAHADLDRAYDLTQAFVSTLADHRDTDLQSWLAQAEQSGIRELTSFAHGIRRDYAAVRAAFTSQWSNGPVEAQVNCLKLQKRLMFGRATFDLLRLHVLCRA